MLFNKKASLEISIQAIVIVVLAMTLLGLGLGFIRGMFRDIGETSSKVNAQVKQIITDELISSDKKLSFPETEITIEKGKSKLLTVGIRNKESKTLTYKIRFSAISDSDGNLISDPKKYDSWFRIAAPPVSGEWILGTTEVDIRNININIPKNTKSGTYVFTFDIINRDFPESDKDNNPYAQKDVFIVITG